MPTYYEWAEISTAPKDGTEILVAFDGKRRIVRWYIGHNVWNMAYPWICQSGQNGWRKDVPTHWMPIPPAPDAQP